MSDDSPIFKFYNCKILRDHSIIKDDLWVRCGKIIDPADIFFEEKVYADVEIDMQGNLITPGFIDIQINGGFGIDFSRNVNDVDLGVQKVAKEILAHGVTAFCPTLVSSKPDIYKKVLPKLKPRIGGDHGAEILGAHLEGPFISSVKRGIHLEENVVKFSEAEKSLYQIYGDIDGVRIVTLAPELEYAQKVITHLREKNINVSLGHSEADFNTAMLAVKNGASMITHLFNAMLPFHHRDPGIVGLLTNDNNHDIYYGIIPDGIHTHPAALRIAHRTHPKGLIIVTDAVSLLGYPNGTHSIGEQTIEITEESARLSGSNTLSGGIISMDQCVKKFQIFTGCSIVDALEAASLIPAKALGIDKKKGTLSFGADADFVVLNHKLDVVSTWIAGKAVYRSHN